MNCLYLDIFSGISGDMFIGALLDLGVDPRQLQSELAKLNVPGYHLHSSRQMRGAIAGTKFDVHIEGEGEHTHLEQTDDHDHHHDHDYDHDHPHPHEHHSHGHGHLPGSILPRSRESHSHAHRTFADIKKLILASQLSDWVKEKSVAVFQRLARAEAKIHGQTPENVHFHEVGAIDSIVDIIGACIALESLGKPKMLASPVTEGTGTVRCAHGAFPLPAPATLEVLSTRNIPVQQCEEPHELVTPTGAALLAEFVETFGPMQDFVPAKIGYGLGTRENKTRPNVLRVIAGETRSPSSTDWESDTIAQLETNLDDINPEILGAFVEKALAAGALDVFFTPVQMKKNRPGVLLSILCPVTEADRLSALLLRETSAFGVRRSTLERRKLHREFVTAKTPYGEVTVKIGSLAGQVVQVAPEFESCKSVAETAKIPLKQVYAAAVKAATP